MSSQPIPVSVSVEAVTKAFSGQAALHGVSLDIRPGELLALLGPSGSGKTTLLRILAGLDFPTSGRVAFDGADALERSVQERNVGFVFQNYALFRHMTVFDNVAFGLRARPRPRRLHKDAIHTRVLELLKLVRLEGFETRYPAQLSGGQRQRVALARALAIEPRILLLDEPFGALDAKVRRELRRWLRELHDETGHTTVFVTHDQDEALELADRIVILNDGRVEQIGTPDEVFDSPASPFVASFVGESNALAVECRQGRVVLGSQSLDLPVDALPRGDGTATLVFRPHDVTVQAPDSPETIRGIVTAERRHGALRRLDVDVDGARISVDVRTDLPHPNAGEPIGLRPSRVWLFGQAPRFLARP